MLIQYNNYKLKDGVKYPFYANHFSELVFISDVHNSYIFDIVDPSQIINKTIKQILKAGYLDQINQRNVLDIFQEPVYHFIYDAEQEKYLMRLLFTLQEKVNFSKEFQSLLSRQTFAIVKAPYPEDPQHYYLTLEPATKFKPELNDVTLETYWLYTLKFSKGQLDMMIEE